MAAAVYVSRSPTTGALYGIVRVHLAEFLAAVNAETDGGGVSGFVVNAFRKFLRCGVLAHGFARVRCGDCALRDREHPLADGKHRVVTRREGIIRPAPRAGLGPRV